MSDWLQVIIDTIFNSLAYLRDLLYKIGIAICSIPKPIKIEILLIILLLGIIITKKIIKNKEEILAQLGFS